MNEKPVLGDYLRFIAIIIQDAMENPDLSMKAKVAIIFMAFTFAATMTITIIAAIYLLAQ